MVIQGQCRGDGHENGSGSPVGINVDCGVRLDNVRLEAVFSTP